MPKLILGSQSPRRQALLKEAGFNFEVRKIDVDELFPDKIAHLEVAEYLAKLKMEAYREAFPTPTIITADTVVIHNNKILGKPQDQKEAEQMLSALSDSTHLVVTGVCISNHEKSHSFSATTEVKVKELTLNEINYYIERFQPFDKAGAYGIQQWFGLIAVEWIKGSYYNVVGLPIDRVYKCLTEAFDIQLR